MLKSAPTKTIIKLDEYESVQLNSLSKLEIAKLDNFSKKIKLEYLYKTGQWKLTAQGWVGHIPITPKLHIAIHPKVPIMNLFGMLDYAYKFNNITFPKGQIQCDPLKQIYEKLADILSKRIIERCRKGLYRDYLPKTEKLIYIRGRIDIRQAIQKPWDVKLKCHYNEQTGDIADNQILAWTLFLIGRTGLCREPVASSVRKAFHTLQGFVTLKSFKPEDCIGRTYNRLNEDYQLLHALCRFFLENTGPTHETGDRQMLPFLIDMARLYELFVAEWLKAHLAEWLKAHLRDDIDIKLQQKFQLGQTSISFKTDIILSDHATGKVLYILDTKYKQPKTTPAAEDVAQVIAYAVTKNCSEVVLVYPITLTNPINELLGKDGIRVRSLTFSLYGDLDQAGETFLSDLFPPNTLTEPSSSTKKEARSRPPNHSFPRSKPEQLPSLPSPSTSHKSPASSGPPTPGTNQSHY